jgi:hypothetical protein
MTTPSACASARARPRSRCARSRKPTTRPRSKRFRQAGFFKNAVSGKSRPQLAVDNDADSGRRIPPDFVVAAPLPFELKAVFFQKADHVAVIIRPHAAGRWRERRSRSMPADRRRRSLRVDQGPCRAIWPAMPRSNRPRSLGRAGPRWSQPRRLLRGPNRRGRQWVEPRSSPREGGRHYNPIDPAEPAGLRNAAALRSAPAAARGLWPVRRPAIRHRSRSAPPPSRPPLRGRHGMWRC